MMKKRLFYLFLYILFLLAPVGAFIDFLVCMYVIFVLRTISFVVIRLSRHCCCIHDYFETTYVAVVGNFIVFQCRTSCYQNFSVKARCNHFPFFEVCSIGPCPHVIVFNFGERFQTCLFLVTVFMGHMGTGGKNGKKLAFSKEN